MKREDEAILDEQQRRRIQARKERRRRRRKQQIIARTILCGSVLILILLIGIGIRRLMEHQAVIAEVTPDEVKYITEAPDFSVELLTLNEYSRPGTALEEVNGIVVHYTANPGTTAAQNRSYFESLSETEETHASSHFIIGISGEIIQCIPCNEISYASNDRNSDTIAIECCIPDDTGKFTDETYDSLVTLTTWLMGRYELTTDDVIRHYDVTGKDCPKYYVENSGAWDLFKADLLTYIDTYGIEKTAEIN